MTYLTRKQLVRAGRALASLTLCATSLWLPSAGAAVPGITGWGGTAGTATFNLQAGGVFITQPDGASVYSFGYGCPKATPPTGFMPAKLTANHCPVAQVPGPTLIVREGDTVTVNLKSVLPPGVGNASIIFSGQQVTASGGVPGVLTQEAVSASVAGTVVTPGIPLSYTFKASKPGTYEYHSGSRPELQGEMGLYGALIVLPATPPASCGTFSDNLTATHNGQPDYRLASAAYDQLTPTGGPTPAALQQTCYDREYLFQLTEMDSIIHSDVLAQVNACSSGLCPPVVVKTDPYHPNYFLVNGRSMPDDMDASFATQYPYQPYNGNPHMKPGELMLIREVGHGRLQHPLHIHANHARVIARDGNLLLSATDGASMAGPLVFTFPTVSGQSVDALFGWTGKGLNWDVYGHGNRLSTPGPSAQGNGDPTPCYADANGYYTNQSPVLPAVPGVTKNYGEWCLDHNRPIPITPPDPQIVANGLWYGGTPFLGVQKVYAGRPQFVSTPLPPGTSIQNPEAGYAFMWHSHNEREITTNDVFPGGMMMMLLIDPPDFFIDETL